MELLINSKQLLHQDKSYFISFSNYYAVDGAQVKLDLTCKLCTVLLS